MKYSALLVGCACAFAFSISARAQVLMLDFGPTESTGTDRLNSPYHTENTAFTDTTWNQVGVNDLNSGALWSNGDGADDIVVNVGASTPTFNTIVSLTTTPSGSTLTGSAFSTGVYAGTAPGRDGIFNGGSGTSRAVGIQIGGLAAGTYDIYITGRNTNTSAGHVQNYYVGKAADAGDFDFTDETFAQKSLTFFASPTNQNLSWSATTLANYVVFSVTLTSDEYLNLAVFGGTGETRGFLNSVQIVAVPEPSTYAALVGCGSLLIAFLRRRKAGSR